MAGADEEPTPLAKLGEAALLISHAYHRLVDPRNAPPWSFHSSNPTGTDLGDIEFLEAGRVIIAGAVLAYTCRATMRPQSSGNNLVWRQIDIKPEKVVVIENTVDAYRNFVAQEQKRTGLEHSITFEIGALSRGTS